MKTDRFMKKHFLLMAVVFALVVTNTREVKAQLRPTQEEAPGHVDESLPDSLKEPALFLYGFYAAYLNAACYGIQMCDNICKAAFSRKLFKRVKQVQQNDLYDPILAANNLTYLTIPTLKVIPLESHWYEVSYQWPWYDKEIKKIPVKVLQDKASFKIVNINNSGKLLLPEEQ